MWRDDFFMPELSSNPDTMEHSLSHLTQIGMLILRPEHKVFLPVYEILNFLLFSDIKKCPAAITWNYSQASEM